MIIAVTFLLIAGVALAQYSPPEESYDVVIEPGPQAFTHVANSNLTIDKVEENCGITELNEAEGGSPMMITYAGAWEYGEFQMHGARTYYINSTVEETCTFEVTFPVQGDAMPLEKNSWNLVSTTSETTANEKWNTGGECVVEIWKLNGEDRDIGEDTTLNPQKSYWLWLNDACGSSDEGDEDDDDGGGGGDDGGGSPSFDDLSIELEKPDGSVQASQDVVFDTSIANSGSGSVEVGNITYNLTHTSSGYDSVIAWNNSETVSDTGFNDEYRFLDWNYRSFLIDALVHEAGYRSVNDIEEFSLSVTAWESYPNGDSITAENTVTYNEGGGGNTPEIDYCEDNFPSNSGSCRDQGDNRGPWEVAINDYEGCVDNSVLVCEINEPEND